MKNENSRRCDAGMETLKLALIGVSHWHVPLYLKAAKRVPLRIAAVSDPDRNTAERFGREFGCKAYTEYRRLLDREKPDFVFAFAPHDQMPEMARELIRRHIPFTMEKPLGLNLADVEAVREDASRERVFCAIPFVWRYSGLLRMFKQKVKPQDIVHLSFRFIAGPPSRYVNTSPWMLEKKRAGGGCMTNLGVHFIDMALYLTGSEAAEIEGSCYHYNSPYNIETYASALCRLSSGATLCLETGYAFPMDEEKRDNRWSIVTGDGYYTLGDNCFEARRLGEKTVRTGMSTDSDDYYSEFVLASLREYLAGGAPSSGLDDMVRVRKILDEMNRAAGAAGGTGA